jgi:hypothetical protein
MAKIAAHRLAASDARRDALVKIDGGENVDR